MYLNYRHKCSLFMHHSVGPQIVSALVLTMSFPLAVPHDPSVCFKVDTAPSSLH